MSTIESNKIPVLPITILDQIFQNVDQISMYSNIARSSKLFANIIRSNMEKYLENYFVRTYGNIPLTTTKNAIERSLKYKYILIRNKDIMVYSFVDRNIPVAQYRHTDIFLHQDFRSPAGSVSWEEMLELLSRFLEKQSKDNIILPANNRFYIIDLEHVTDKPQSGKERKIQVVLNIIDGKIISLICDYYSHIWYQAQCIDFYSLYPTIMSGFSSRENKFIYPISAFSPSIFYTLMSPKYLFRRLHLYRNIFFFINFH